MNCRVLVPIMVFSSAKIEPHFSRYKDGEIFYMIRSFFVFSLVAFVGIVCNAGSDGVVGGAEQWFSLWCASLRGLHDVTVASQSASCNTGESK